MYIPKTVTVQNPDLNKISHVVDSWDEFEQWTRSHDVDDDQAYHIMVNARDSVDAERIWENTDYWV